MHSWWLIIIANENFKTFDEIHFFRISLFINAADQPANEQETRFALAVVELQVRHYHHLLLIIITIIVISVIIVMFVIIIIITRPSSEFWIFFEILKLLQNLTF